MISEFGLFCVDFIFTVVTVPLILIFLTPIWLYKNGVKLLVKIIHPNYIALSKNDPFMVWDIIKPSNGRLVYSVGVSIHLNGSMTLERLRIKLMSEILNLVDKNGKKLHPRFYENFVLFGGYAFRKSVDKFDINLQIRQVSLGDETLSSFKVKWIEMSYAPGTSPWEFVLIPLEDVGETIILMKIHHALADAYSLLHIFNTLLDNNVPQVPKEVEDSFWDITRQFFRAVRVAMTYSLKVKSTSSSLPWKLDSTLTPAHVASTTLYFPDLKNIQRMSETHFSSITLSLFGGVLSRILSESTNSEAITEDKRATYVQLSFPWPNHPLTTLCNHWTSGGIRVPIGKMKPKDRLKIVDENYKNFMGSEMDKILKRFMFPIALLFPVKLFQSFFEYTRRLNGLRTVFTSAMAYNENYYEFDGNPFISVSPLTGLLGTTPALSGLAFTYKDQVQCTFIATSEVAKDQETIDKIIKCYFVEEVEKLIEDLST